MTHQLHLISARSASQVLGTSPQTIRNMAKAGTLTAFRVGNAIKIDADELRKYIDANRIGGAR